MATIRFREPERGKLLAAAVTDTLAGLDPSDEAIRLDALKDLARALKAGDGKRFDELLVAHFRDVALAAIGVGVTGEPPREAPMGDTGVEAE